ncbi:NAD(P)-binding protein [Auriscalpium vulgare]|uniref:NAD(P)-binding protein n=1 Tax=Auriscalpium vulgare TaxID=40419 RepID=A0ACB8R8N6_9AGAM|nr:NAD(P)-binding protein [Auriscalpium vulgare]
MSPVTNARTLFNEVPTGYPVPGQTTVHDTTQTIDLENEPLNGGILAKTLVLSVDPVFRRWMSINPKTGKPIGFVLGQPLSGDGIAKVVRSENPQFKPGDYIKENFPFQEYFVRKDDAKLELVIENHGLDWSAHVGTLGMPGRTAYYGWREYANPTKASLSGETIFVTTGAGPIGSFVVQLAKRAGLKVIASASTDEKVAFIRSLGADVVFNYKTESTEEVLEREGPLDIYWDNVGGEILDIALSKAKGVGARFIECGMISLYNESDPYRLKNAYLILSKEITVYGFWVGRWDAKYREEFNREVPELIKAGQLKHLEDVSDGLEHAGAGIADVMQGRNFGKKVIVVAKE